MYECQFVNLCMINFKYQLCKFRIYYPGTQSEVYWWKYTHFTPSAILNTGCSSKMLGISWWWHYIYTLLYSYPSFTTSCSEPFSRHTLYLIAIVLRSKLTFSRFYVVSGEDALFVVESSAPPVRFLLVGHVQHVTLLVITVHTLE